MTSFEACKGLVLQAELCGCGGPQCIDQEESRLLLPRLLATRAMIVVGS